MKVSIFKLIKWGFFLRDEINEAFKDDGKLSANELLIIYKRLEEEINLPVDEKLTKIIHVIGELADGLLKITEDNRVSVKEILVLSEHICNKLGFDLDTTGFDIPEIKLPKHESPLLDQLEAGPWPSFVAALNQQPEVRGKEEVKRFLKHLKDVVE